MKNKGVKIGVIVGAILAIPFFVFLLPALETGVYTENDGICPYHEYEAQIIQKEIDNTLISTSICENRLERGIPEGKITGGGFTCVDGIYYQTNYRCITKTLGFIESEAGITFLVWIFLAEIYGILLGGILGFMASKLGKRK